MAAGSFVDSDGGGVLKADMADDFDRERTSLVAGIYWLVTLQEVKRKLLTRNTRLFPSRFSSADMEGDIKRTMRN